MDGEDPEPMLGSNSGRSQSMETRAERKGSRKEGRKEKRKG